MLRSLFARLAALPLIAVCTLSAQDDDHNYARWEGDMQRFEASDEEATPKKGHVLFVGSSSIRMWDLDKWFPDAEYINRGFGGSEIVDSTHFADRIILKHEPRHVLLYAGDNDIANGKDAERVLSDFKNFVETVRKELPEAKISFIAIKPSISRWKLAPEMAKANLMVMQYADETEGVDYIDIWRPMIGEDGKPMPNLFLGDGLHLNEKGYEMWTGIVKEHLAETEKAKPE